MKKQLLKKVLCLLVMSIALVACSDEEDQSVLVTKGFWDRAQIAANNGSDFKGNVFSFLKNNMDEYDAVFSSYQNSFDNSYNKVSDMLEKCIQSLDAAEAKVDATDTVDFEKVQKTANKYLPDAIIATNNGECGYIDLGLPSGTLWATSNLGVQQKDKLNKNFNEYFALSKPQRPEAPKLPETKNIREYVIAKSAEEVEGDIIEVPYKEFVATLEKTNFEAPSTDNINRLVSGIKDELLENIEERVKDFRDYQVFEYQRIVAPKYVEEFNKAYNQYNFDLLTHDYSYLLDVGERYSWGTNFVMDDKNGPTAFPASEDWATVLLGSNWATPTKEQVEELLQYCESTQVSINDFDNGSYTGKIQGYELKSKINGKTLFFPNYYKCWINERVNYNTYYAYTAMGIEKVQERNPQYFIRPVYKIK